MCIVGVIFAAFSLFSWLFIFVTVGCTMVAWHEMDVVIVFIFLAFLYNFIQVYFIRLVERDIF